MASAPYPVPAEVTWVHDNVPRYEAAGGKMVPAPNTFTASFDWTLLNDSYWGGVYTGAVALATTGVIVGVVLLLAYVTTCARRPKHRARLVARPVNRCDHFFGCVANGCAKWCFVAGGAVAVLLSISSLAMATGLKAAASGGVDSLRSLRNTLTDADNLLRDGLSVQVTAAASDAQALYAAASAQPVPADLLAAIAGAVATVNGATADVATLSAQVTSATDAVWKGWDAATSYAGGGSLDALPDRVVGWFAGAAVGYFVLALSVLGCLLPSTAAAYGYRGLGAPFTVLWAAVVFAVLGGLVAVSLVSADVCAAPNAAVAVLLNATVGTSGLDAGLVGPSVSWYATGDCGYPGAPSPPPASAGAFMATGQAALVGALALMASNVTPALNASYPALLPQADALTGDLVAANASLATLSGAYLSCPGVHGTYVSMLNALCGSGAVAFIRLWIIAIVGTAAALVAACAGARLCQYHPGDPDPFTSQRVVDAVATMRTPGGGLVTTTVGATSLPGSTGVAPTSTLPAASPSQPLVGTGPRVSTGGAGGGSSYGAVVTISDDTSSPAAYAGAAAAAKTKSWR